MIKRCLIISILLLCTMSASAQLNKEYFYYVGRSFLIESKYRDAVETLNILLKVDPKADEGYFLRGVAKYNLDDLLGADMDFTRALEENPVYTMAYQYRAITRSRLGNYDDALKDFQEAIDLRPDLPGPYYSRGVTYLLSQQFSKAVADFTTFIKYENRVIDAYINRGTSHLYLKDTVSAMRDYDQAIKTNRESPKGYNQRGVLFMSQKKYDQALQDFNMAIACDSKDVISHFNRALVYSNTKRPMLAINDFSRVLEIDSTNSLTYFNRAILRSQIGDYNNALKDYDKVALYSPDNVLVYYNRAGLYSQLGDYQSAINDYTRSIQLYPDFANAYLGRSSLRYMLKDLKGSEQDKKIANKKIAEYRSKLTDSTFSIYADTSKQFNQLLSFDSNFGSKSNFDRMTSQSSDITILPMFKFTLMKTDSTLSINPHKYHIQKVDDFIAQVGDKYLVLSNQSSNISNDSLFAIDKTVTERLRNSAGSESWQLLFSRGLSQSLIRQYTGAINSYTTAIDRNPSNPFLYINRSTTQSEMIDFISSIDNSYQSITIDSDPVSRLKNQSAKVYNYDDAIADLNKAAKLLPEFAHIYYNRANLLCLSGQMPEAFDDYTKAIELNPYFAEAYFNRGLVQIFMKDTRKGCLDLSKAGELGIQEAYKALKIYGSNN